MTCKNCHHELPESLNTCPYCGATVNRKNSQKTQNSMYSLCSKCGRKITIGTKQCPACDNSRNMDIGWTCTKCGKIHKGHPGICNLCAFDNTPKTKQGTDKTKGIPMMWQILAMVLYIYISFNAQRFFGTAAVGDVFATVAGVFLLTAAALFLRKENGKKLLPMVMLLGAAIVVFTASTMFIDIVTNIDLSQSHNLAHAADAAVPVLISVCFGAFAWCAWKQAKAASLEQTKQIQKTMQILTSAGLVCAVLPAAIYVIDYIGPGFPEGLLKASSYLKESVPLPLAMFFTDRFLREE